MWCYCINEVCSQLSVHTQMCSRSCRVGPMLACDYCPLLFHLDCLDPPLTTAPTHRWMCPNHPEHFLVSPRKTLHSVLGLPIEALLRCGQSMYHVQCHQSSIKVFWNICRCFKQKFAEQHVQKSDCTQPIYYCRIMTHRLKKTSKSSI